MKAPSILRTIIFILPLWLLTLSAAITAPCRAQAPSSPPTPPVMAGKTLQVATRIVPPFVTRNDGQFDGFSVALWQAIAAQMGARTQWDVQPNVGALLGAVKSGKDALGIAAISVTSERAQDFDFSQPMFESGLQILIRDEPSQNGGMLASLRAIFGPTLLQMFGIVLLLILIPAHVIWLTERRHPSGMLESKHYFPGIFEAAWWALSTLATQADSMPRSGAGRVMAIIWMFVGVIFVAYFTATITTAQTVQSLQGGIQSVKDLPGKRVATITGSTSDAYLRGLSNVTVRDYPAIGDACDALNKREVDAVVFDAPVLLYYANNDGKGKVKVVGTIFRKENYAIAFPPNSPYRKPVNEALLRLREDGTYDTLYTKWFGSD